MLYFYLEKIQFVADSVWHWCWQGLGSGAHFANITIPVP